MRRRVVVSAVLGLLPVLLLAQAEPRPTFDVVSIKQNRTNQGIPVVAFQPGGRIIAGNVVVRQVILVAYGLEDVQLSARLFNHRLACPRLHHPRRLREVPWVQLA